MAMGKVRWFALASSMDGLWLCIVRTRDCDDIVLRKTMQ
jgi:hypothetical protein